MDLFDAQGHRLYLTAGERAAFLHAARRADRHVRTFRFVLHHCGCRVFEGLALTPQGFDLAGKVIVVEALKNRRRGVYRAVPVPGDVLGILSTWFMASQRPQNATERLRLKDRRGTGPGRPHGGG